MKVMMGRRKRSAKRIRRRAFRYPGMGTSEIAEEIFFCIPTFLVAEEDNALPVQGGQTADQRAIFTKGAVAPEFEEFGGAVAQVVEQVRALRVANDLNTLPRG